MRPSILGFFTVGMTTLSMLSVSFLYSLSSKYFICITDLTCITITFYKLHSCNQENNSL